MTSKKRILETLMWAKCHSTGDISPTEIFKISDKKWFLLNNVNLLLLMMPKKTRAEIDEEKKDYLIYKTEYSIFHDKTYKKIVGIDYEGLYRKICEKMSKNSRCPR